MPLCSFACKIKFLLLAQVGKKVKNSWCTYLHQWNFWPFFQHGPVIEIWFFKQNCKIAYVLALPEDICAIIIKFVIHILKALDISYWKMQENGEIISNHIVHFWTILDKNTQKRILCSKCKPNKIWIYTYFLIEL